MDHGARFLEPGFSLPCGFLWHPGVSRFCRHAADQDDPGGRQPTAGKGEGRCGPSCLAAQPPPAPVLQLDHLSCSQITAA